MDCVGCDKCKLWGKLQVTGLGTALKVRVAFRESLDGAKFKLPFSSQILFWADNTTKRGDGSAAAAAGAALDATEEELQTLRPPRDELQGSAFRWEFMFYVRELPDMMSAAE